MKLKHKMVLTNIILLSAFSAIIMIFVCVKVFGSFDEIRTNAFEFFVSEKKRSLSNIVQIAYGIIESEYSLKNISDKKKKENVILKLSNLKYNNYLGYFFAYELHDNDASFAFHATRPELNGKTTNLDLFDENPDRTKRKRFRREIIEKALNGGGFVMYYYDKYDENNNIIKKDALKMSYGLYFKPWNWVIASGIYLDGVEGRFKSVADFLLRQKDFVRFGSIAITLFIIIISIFVIYGQSKTVDNVIKKIKNRIERLNIGDVDSTMDNEQYMCDDLREISYSLDDFIYTIREEIKSKNEDAGELLYPKSETGVKEIDIVENGICDLTESEMKQLTAVMNGMHNRYVNSGLTSDSAEQLEYEFLEMMKSRKLYLKSDITLNEVAKILNSNPSYLSQVLNARLQISFRDLLNWYRLEEFKTRVNEIHDKKENILSLAFTCGFRSKSSFNSIFKKHYGITPRDYIRKHDII